MPSHAERDDYDYEKHRADRRIGREKPEDRERREKKKAAVGPEVLKKENRGEGHKQEPKATIRSRSESGENQRKAFQTGSAQQRRMIPWKRTNLTARRHHEATCIPRRSVAGSIISKRIEESSAKTPRETWPAVLSTASAVARP